jgi:hypothetical protein
MDAWDLTASSGKVPWPPAVALLVSTAEARRRQGCERAGPPGPQEGLREVRGDMVNMVMGIATTQRHRRTTVRSGAARLRRNYIPASNRV